jgi:hypothetical protein
MKLPCPLCERQTEHIYHATEQHRQTYWFRCRYAPCRTSFRAVQVPDLPLQVTHMSPPVARKPEPRLGLMGCPSCGAYGKVKTSYKREDGYWRRHQCPACGPYFTCEQPDEGAVTIHKKMKLKSTIDEE